MLQSYFIDNCQYILIETHFFVHILQFLIHFMQNRLYQDIVSSSHEAVPH